MLTNSFTWRTSATALFALVATVTTGALTPAFATTQLLSEAWSAEAVSAEGYDLLLELDPHVVYVGGLVVIGGSNALVGNGAILDLQGDAVRTYGYGTRLDVDGVVFINGGAGTLSAALHLASGTKSHVRNCVFYDCTIGLRMEAVFAGQNSSVTNCIFAGNAYWGAMFHDIYTPTVLTCVAWDNGASPIDDYGIFCGCTTEDPAGWTPPATNGCAHDDPLFVNPSADAAACDFHLRAGSPCWGSGTPAGTNIGAYTDDPLPVWRMTWSAVKSAYRLR